MARTNATGITDAVLSTQSSHQQLANGSGARMALPKQTTRRPALECQRSFTGTPTASATATPALPAGRSIAALVQAAAIARRRSGDARSNSHPVHRHGGRQPSRRARRMLAAAQTVGRRIKARTCTHVAGVKAATWVSMLHLQQGLTVPALHHFNREGHFPLHCALLCARIRHRLRGMSLGDEGLENPKTGMGNPRDTKPLWSH